MLEKGLKVEAEGLLKLIDRGDEAAFAKLYALYSKRLTAFSIFHTAIFGDG